MFDFLRNFEILDWGNFFMKSLATPSIVLMDWIGVALLLAVWFVIISVW